jgi:hypothetical protein
MDIIDENKNYFMKIFICNKFDDNYIKFPFYEFTKRLNKGFAKCNN